MQRMSLFFFLVCFSMLVATPSVAAGSIAAAHAAAVRDKAVSRCKACHTFEKGGRHKTGPNLYGILGRKAGSADGFNYSKSLKDADFVWTEDKLRLWIADAKKAIKQLTGDPRARTKMPRLNITGPKADDVIAYLKAISPAAAGAEPLAKGKEPVVKKTAGQPVVVASKAEEKKAESIKTPLQAAKPSAAGREQKVHRDKPKDTVPATAKAAAVREVPQAEVDRLLDNLPPLDLNAPEQMGLHDQATVKLVLPSSQDLSTLSARFREAAPNGNVYLEAILKGEKFEIDATTSERQEVIGPQPHKWQWQIKAKEAGLQHLQVSLNAIVTQANQTIKRELRTLDHSVTVVAETKQEPIPERHSWWLWLILGSVVVAILWVWGRRAKA